MIFHGNLSDSKSLQVSRTLLNILADFKNAVVWIVSTRPLISKSSSSCTNPLVTVSGAPSTIGITVTFMIQSFFQFPSKVLFDFFQFYSVIGRDSKVYNSEIIINKKRIFRLDTTWRARWFTANCARNWNLILRTNGICTTQNMSLSIRRTNFSEILSYKRII